MFLLQSDLSIPEVADVEAAVEQGSSYITGQLVPNAIAGDPAALAIATIGSIIGFILLYKLSEVFYALIKRLFLFIIVGFSLYFLLLSIESRLALEGVSTQLVILGIVGIGLGLLAFVKTLLSLKRHVRSHSHVSTDVAADVPADTTPSFTPTQVQAPKMMTTQGFTRQQFLSELKSDRSLLSVLSYVIVAEFGVFSSVTQAAPTIEAGIGITVAFFIGAFVFIRTTYHDYLRGIRHLIAATIFAFVLSLILGVYWTSQYMFLELLSLQYFVSPSLVALLTGIAVSLFMGSKN